MPNFTAAPKIQNCIENIINEHLDEWKNMLRTGNLLGFEKSLSTELLNISDSISQILLTEVGTELKGELSKQAKAEGARKLVIRGLSIRLQTGTTIKVESPYIKGTVGDWTGSRHLLATHWGIIEGVSPELYNKVGYCAALGPSYNISQQTLSRFGTTICLSTTRDITNKLAVCCAEYGEEELMLKESESVVNKRVVIAIDGGRTRIRSYTGEVNELGNSTYDTSWREPKLFVIDVIDNDGNVEKHSLPIYGVRFGEEDCMDLLESYLRKLKIEEATEIQLLGDGAPWIWNQFSALMKRLNVDSKKVTETLDYYHSSSYVHDLVERMPLKVSEVDRKKYLKDFKDWLWMGKADRIVAVCREIYKKPCKEVKRCINYLEKHQPRMQYATYDDQKLMCASGIVESAIRRIINLRFKNAATFWDKDCVEKLFFLRAAVLSNRWDNVIQRLAMRK